MSQIPIFYAELECVYAQTVARGLRRLAVSAANPGEGVSFLARALARRGAATGLRTLLMDFNSFHPADTARGSWRPDGGSVRTAIVPIAADGLDFVPASSLASTDLSFRDPHRLRELLKEELADYDLIIADTSAVNRVNGRSVPPGVVAAACDAAVLVILAGVTTGHAARVAAASLRESGAELAGVVMNDRDNPMLVNELCREVERLRPFAPRLADWLERRLRGNALLRLHP